ncbi:nuclease [Bacillus thuringiensis]|uniref:GIY-YIG nuclease family protein n=1 Tax=Bacillus TaxID=1386 RepID=UPI0007FB4562|nr:MULTISPECIES: GIY-YIG nuclease family protein [Bacillus]AUB62677.1 nuclease [Bacillus cereus]KAB2366927.1 nuclease [Bacillus thuringiensis]MBJ8123963.1 nuclease [Bacillus cereus]MCU4713274.1 nuclease [Bacillus cereus]MCU5487871.1 nuclease [Bacillus cereus]
MYGIYYLKINGKYYIGKDVNVSNLKRIREHMWMLKSGTHYNRYLQAVYCKYESTLEYGILEEIECSLEELSEIEQQYIWLYDSYNNGYNLTLGGEGLGGIKFTEEQLEKKRQRVIGEKNPQSKITDAQFFEIVELLKCGKTNPEIADMYNLHPNYVSLIRHKKRYKYLWGKVQNYLPVKSEHQLKTRGRVTLEMFLDIVQMLQAGESNASIERKHGLSSGTGSRIRHRKLYKQWWVRYVDKGTFNDYPNGGEIPQEE